MPVDGTFPTATTQWEKRNIALEIPVWDEQLCIQCGKCVLVCPHAAIRAKVYDAAASWQAPRRPSSPCRRAGRTSRACKYTLQVAPEDCTGCALCVRGLPGQEQDRSQAQGHQHGRRSRRCASPSATNWDFFLSLPDTDRKRAQHRARSRTSSCCGRCSSSPAPAPAAARRPYVKLLTQLFGDRALIANATGCSSIYGGNLPTTPYCQNARRAAARPGPTRCSRTTPSSASACA